MPVWQLKIWSGGVAKNMCNEVCDSAVDSESSSWTSRAEEMGKPAPGWKNEISNDMRGHLESMGAGLDVVLGIYLLRF